MLTRLVLAFWVEFRGFSWHSLHTVSNFDVMKKISLFLLALSLSFSACNSADGPEVVVNDNGVNVHVYESETPELFPSFEYPEGWDFVTYADSYMSDDFQLLGLSPESDMMIEGDSGFPNESVVLASFTHEEGNYAESVGFATTLRMVNLEDRSDVEMEGYTVYQYSGTYDFSSFYEEDEEDIPAPDFRKNLYQFEDGRVVSLTYYPHEGEDSVEDWELVAESLDFSQML